MSFVSWRRASDQVVMSLFTCAGLSSLSGQTHAAQARVCFMLGGHAQHEGGTMVMSRWRWRKLNKHTHETFQIRPIAAAAAAIAANEHSSCARVQVCCSEHHACGQLCCSDHHACGQLGSPSWLAAMLEADNCGCRRSQKIG